ncbi:MAG TPA: ABC transporter permease [Candidatus Bathyarchaeia archaeon]|nr:ABC transporter permease [Candidatus Bathyarchaeia archaeon]
MTLLYDTESLFKRALTKVVRNPSVLFAMLLQPLLFLLLFSQLLQKLTSLPGLSGSYINYLTPGILVMTAILGSFQPGMSIVNDLNSGFLQKLLLTPVNRAAVLLGRLMTDMLVLIIQSAIIIAVAIPLGLSIATGLPGLVLILATLVFFGMAWAGLLLAVGIKTRKAETLSAIGNLLALPIIFVSSALFPTRIMPQWAQTVSDYNPVSYASNVARDLIQGGLTWSTFISAYSVIGIMAIVTFAATLYQFRKVIS